MVKVDVIEGTVNDVLWCHYDLAGDVLYLRLASERHAWHSTASGKKATGRIRTDDLRFTKPLLCRLSYGGN